MEDINQGRCIEAERKNQGKVVRIARPHLRAWREMRSSTGPDNCQRSFTPIEVFAKKVRLYDNSSFCNRLYLDQCFNHLKY